MYRFIQKISKLHEKQIYNIVVNLPRLLLLAMVLLYAYLMLFTTNINDMRLFLLIVIVLVIIIFCLISSLGKVSNFILNERIELGKYTNLLFLLHKGARNKIQKKEYFQQYQIGEGTILYLKGNFQGSLEKLQLVNFEKISKKHQKKYQDLVTYYLCLGYLQIGDAKKIGKKLEELPNNYLIMLQAVQAIKQGETTHYFKNTVPKNHLQSVSTNYYSALNELNQGHTDRAKAFFQHIAGENPDLFYVQEAKTYLEHKHL